MAWISILMQRNVEELVLINGGILPPGLFTCESLTVLELKMAFLYLPELVYFPNLKILRLKYIKFENEQLIQVLLTDSPMLEELRLTDCRWNDIKCLCILGPNLKRLFIKSLSNKYIDIKINAPNLQSLKYSSGLAKDFVLHNFSTLLDAEINLSGPDNLGKRGELAYLGTKLFVSLSNVKRLSISDYCLKLLTHQDLFKTNLPLFRNLTHLEVASGLFFSRYYGYDEGNLPYWIVGKLLDFLQVLINLESLIFLEGFRGYESDDNDGWSLDLMPQCMLLQLKSVEFRGFQGKPIEKELIRWFLKNANALRRARIIISGMSYLKSLNFKKKVADELALFPRGSPECVLHVS